MNPNASKLRQLLVRYRIGLFASLALALGVGLGLSWSTRQVGAPTITQDDITAAVIRTIETEPLPSRAALAAEKVRQAVVRVRGYQDDRKEDSQSSPSAAPDKSAPQQSTPKMAPRKVPNNAPHAAPNNAPKSAPKSAPKAESEETPGAQIEASIGSGVLISDEGLILTNLHVVAGSKRLTVTFFDGSETDAEIVGLRPENDLAVIKVKKLPDDIEPATLGGSQGLSPGDEVVAVGFPFGIGPSVSAGVVSGLNRELPSSKSGRTLRGLIQFDAAANPGNSGGPLINMSGEVVGIVTAIFTPNRSRTFIGIGFAVTMEAAGGGAGIPPL